MRLKYPIPGTARAWWLGFALLIGIPVTVLAALGLRMVDLERVQRRQQIAEQQSQTALLVDTSIGAALNRIEHELAKSGSENAKAGAPFVYSTSGTLLVPADRIFFAEIGAEPVDLQLELEPPLRSELEQALAAEAQNNVHQATRLFENLAKDARVKAWATLALARLEIRHRPQTLLEWARRHVEEDLDAVSPSGMPVALIAAGYTELLPPAARTEFAHFMEAVLHRLRSGAWWLRYEQRASEDSDLRHQIALAGLPTPPDDPRLTQLAAINRAVKLATLRRDGPTRLFVEGPVPLLVFAVPDASDPGRWRGIALARSDIQSLIAQALTPIAAGVSYPLALRDNNGYLIWGSKTRFVSARAFELHSIDRWTLAAGDPGVRDSPYRTLFWYCFIALLVVVLSLGAVMTVRVISREMELARLQTEFSAAVTHEFKSPITSIRLLAERIASGRVAVTGSLREYADLIDQQAERLEQLVNRLLQSHKIQAGKIRYHIAPHAVYNLAQTAVTRLETRAKAKRIDIRITADDKAIEILLDGAAIQDSLQNLIDNAIKYSPPDTVIEVKVRHAPEEVSIAIADQGIGIDNDELPRVFDRFYRTKHAAAQAVSGTGLGLSLVKAAAEAHGGRVEVKSRPGEGSVFCIVIPIRDEDQWLAS